MEDLVCLQQNSLFLPVPAFHAPYLIHLRSTEAMAAQQSPPHVVKTRLVFSDLDGTLIHYGDVLEGVSEGEIIRLPTTHSGAQGVISAATLRMLAALRAMGVKLVLISGARSSTLLQRLPYLPAADAYVCESGGRIFFPDSSAVTAAPISEDLAWRARHEAAGPPSQDALPPAQRQGPLWEWYTSVAAAGWKADAVNYTTAFRVQRTPGRSDEEMAALRGSAPPQLATAGNLGALDFFPMTSGKERAAAYLMNHFGVPSEHSVLLCDDDNDLGLAATVRCAYLPGITAASVQEAVDAAPDRFYVSPMQGCRGTEDILRHLLHEQLGS